MSIPGMESWAGAGEDGGICDCCAGSDGTQNDAAAASRIIANFLSIIFPMILWIMWLLLV
jgi:hypothetical protein